MQIWRVLGLGIGLLVCFSTFCFEGQSFVLCELDNHCDLFFLNLSVTGAGVLL